MICILGTEKLLRGINPKFGHKKKRSKLSWNRILEKYLT
jgi:hypothetical protein